MKSKKINDTLFFIRTKDPNAFGGECDWVVWVDKINSNQYRVQMRYENANRLLEDKIPFEEKAKQIARGYRPGSGNALPGKFTLA